MNIIKQWNFCVVIIPQLKSFFEASTMTFAHLARFEMNTSPSLQKDAGQNLRITYRLSTRLSAQSLLLF